MALPNESDLFKGGSVSAEADPTMVNDEYEVVPEGVEVEVIDDTPPRDRNRPALTTSPEPTDEELESYSEDVRKKLSKMKHGIHDERRAKESAQRERDEAIQLAKRAMAERQDIESRFNHGEEVFVGQSREKLDMKMSEAKRAYKAAYELGDADKMADAQEAMAMLAADRKQVDGWANNVAQRKQQKAGQEQETSVNSQPTQQAAQPQPDEDAVKWAKKNPWFGDHTPMTYYAYGVDAELTKAGVDPRADAEEYYTRLDTEMRERFPDYAWTDNPKKRSVNSVVSPVSRTAARGSKTRITLTQSQLSVAKRLGLTPIQYATELAKLEA